MVASLTVLALGFVIGACNFPCVKLGRIVASRIGSQGGDWIYMLITMAVWFAVMALVIEVANIFNSGILSFQSRRHNAVFLLAGFLLGLHAGRAILRHFERNVD
jgi:hypothetical protein